MTGNPTGISYDEVPYPILSHSKTHPDRLATVATLLGASPQPVTQCRVLELGCACGGNLIPMACGLSESEFLGVDISARQIAQGEAIVAALGVENLVLRQMDILDIGSDLGHFDYIIAHGVFSWVDRAVRDKLLEICRENLAPNGVAYVSYNAYPGWHMLDVPRNLMRYHTRSVVDPHERVAQARSVIDFFAQAVQTEESAYGSFFGKYAEYMRGESTSSAPKDDSALLWDELAEVNQPFYFHQFVERAELHGLQYLGEAEFHTMVGSNFPRDVLEALDGMAHSVVEFEQYLDFWRNRTFRRTLLCHQAVSIDRGLKPQRLKGFYVASAAQPEDANPDLEGRTIATFRASDGAVLSTDHPVTKAAMTCLGDAWPRALPFEALLEAAYTRLGQDAEALDPAGRSRDTWQLGANLLKGYGYSDKLVELHVHAPGMALDVGERPVASPVARFQAARGPRVTNLRHERVELDTLDRYLVSLLDGHHDRAALVECLLEGPVAEGRLVIEQDGERVETQDAVRRILAKGLQARLEWLAEAALLTAQVRP